MGEMGAITEIGAETCGTKEATVVGNGTGMLARWRDMVTTGVPMVGTCGLGRTALSGERAGGGGAAFHPARDSNGSAVLGMLGIRDAAGAMGLTGVGEAECACANPPPRCSSHRSA